MILLKDLLKEITESDLTAGTDVYHGTSSKYIQNILKRGLDPKPNKWMVKYLHGPERSAALRELPKELFVTTNIQHARDFAEAASEYGGTPIILQFTIEASDIIKTDPVMSDSYIVQNKIQSNRLTVAEPKDFNLAKVQSNIQASLDKTQIIRQINLILKPYNKKIKSGSKTTDRILGYEDGWFATSIPLKDFNLIMQGKSSSANDEDTEFTKKFIENISDTDIKKMIDIISN